MKTSNEPCPFCGSMDIRCEHFIMGSVYGREYYVTCANCHTDGPSGISEHDALRNWNHKSHKPPHDTPADSKLAEEYCDHQWRYRGADDENDENDE